MRQIASKLTLLSGLLLVTTVACTDRSPERAPRTTPSVVVEVTPAPIEEPLTYTVVAGDFLSQIAARFDVTVEELAEINEIENAALIEIGQVLVIPGQQTVAVDPFFATAPGEPWPEIYPRPSLPPPPEPSPLDELRNRIAAWPWPPRATMVKIIVAGGFALAALIAWLMLASAEYKTRRWATRAVPRGARRTFHAWGNAAVMPRNSYLAVRRRALAAWAMAVAGSQTFRRTVEAVDQRYRRVRAAVIVGWSRTEGQRAELLERARPLLERADDVAGRAVDATLYRTREIVDTVRERAPATTDSFQSFGGRATTSIRRTVKSGAERARREAFEPPPVQERWRSRIAGELARAFERNQLEVRYVPVIDLDARALSAIEAHLFWQHPQRGLMAARDIHTATQEHPELSAALLEFLLEQSCTFLKDEVDQRFPSAQLIVPITLEQIVESEPLAAIDRGLTTADLALDRLKVSIAEPHALHDTRTAATFIRNLRSMGIGVHLDDYGIAETSELQQLGVSSVTVNFAAAGSSPEAREILSEAVEVAQDLRLPVTARHARNEAAQALQVSLGCSFEAIGEPIPAKAFVTTYVEERRPDPIVQEQPAALGTSVWPDSAGAAVNAAAADAAANDSADESAAPVASVSSEAASGPARQSVDDIIGRQTQRAAGPLRLTRNDDDTPATPNDTTEDDAPILINGLDDTEEGADGDDESTENADAGRPVDAA